MRNMVGFTLTLHRGVAGGLKSNLDEGLELKLYLIQNERLKAYYYILFFN